MHLFRDGDSDLPWTAATFGLAISSIWYWCTDQVRSARIPKTFLECKKN